jgi:hypothetical protein
MPGWIDNSDWRFKRAPEVPTYTDIGRDRRPTPEMIADARRRAVAPRTLTSSVCGDPAPGQSALDKRNAACPA